MATDVARRSFDPARRYTGVATQQGRVTLEAEENEERTIGLEERRLELIDIIGPAGTPDDGYAITAAGGFDFTIGPGTMYVGGNRVSLEEAITYLDQPDWLDQVGDPEFVEYGDDRAPGLEHVVLVLTETDVTATEDPVLREVALGGPDAAARTRLIQRVHRLVTDGRSCEDAVEEAIRGWEQRGQTFDPETMELRSKSRLLVTWDPPTEPPDPCEPAAKGGYLGAENQAIRVQVTRAVEDQFDIVWGYDNASFLYRVTPDASANPILTLDRSPVDDFHRPRTGQAVQVLRAAADLVTTDAAVEGWVAAHNGDVGVLAAPYDPDTRSVAFPAPLPAEYLDDSQTPQLFLRVWEQHLTGNTFGTPVVLLETGVAVTLDVDSGNGPLHVGDYWTIGVRPATPDTVLPARLLRTPQPPDGPRSWACPLAVIDWPHREVEIVEDCRVPFGPLTECCNNGCDCDISVTPRDARSGRLQELIDRATRGRDVKEQARRITICFEPGRYELARPIVLRRQHSNVHLVSCGEGAVILARPGRERRFAQGLVILLHADEVRMTGFEFELPLVPVLRDDVTPTVSGLRSAAGALSALFRDLSMSIGIRPLHCAMLEVERCLFRFRVGEATPPPEGDERLHRHVFGVGIFAGSECWGMRLERNRFLHDPIGPPRSDVIASERAAALARPAGGGGGGSTGGGGGISAEESDEIFDIDVPRDVPPIRILVGLLLMPTLVMKGKPSGSGSTGLSEVGSDVVVTTKPALLRSLLTRARIEDNEFSGLTFGIAAVGELGDVRIENNTIRECYGGIWLMSFRRQILSAVGEYEISDKVSENMRALIQMLIQSAAADERMWLVTLVARVYPLPDEFLDEDLVPLLVQSQAAATGRSRGRSRATRSTRSTRSTASAEPESPTRMHEFVRRSTTAFEAERPADSSGPTVRTRTSGEPVLLRVTPPTADSAETLAANQLAATLVEWDLAFGFEPYTAAFELRLAHNDIECTFGEGRLTGPPLLVWQTDSELGGTALLSDNRFTGMIRGAAAALLDVPGVIATGNLVLNAYTLGISLATVSPEAVAVTGNILRGLALLPPRLGVPAPLDTWRPLNHEIP